MKDTDDNPNARWENCDYLLWPNWYHYLTWGIILALLASVAVLSALEQL
ncbi:hypothetical protein A54_114 [Septuagintavirus sv54]|uniref:Uncharacterized protein n=1 Tax=Escherichia phage A5-4 TaxID=2996162 RepID=A0AAE9PTK9_9CAUD|nr:hypothetical protein A54_114 [Escherichia phage A5-4]